jgi:hypothetical protein
MLRRADRRPQILESASVLAARQQCRRWGLHKTIGTVLLLISVPVAGLLAYWQVEPGPAGERALLIGWAALIAYLVISQIGQDRARAACDYVLARAPARSMKR